MNAVPVRHHEVETNIYGCNMYLIGGIKKFNRVPVTPLLISTLKLTRSPRCYHYCTRPFGFFFFSRPIIFLFSHFREGNVIKKIALTRRNLTVTKRICSIFVKCTLPKKKKKKHLPRDYSKTLQVVTFSLYLMVLKKFQHQVQRVHLPRKTY